MQFLLLITQEKAKEAGELMDKESKYCLKMECMHYVRTLLLDKKTYNMVEKKNIRVWFVLMEKSHSQHMLLS